MPLGEFIINVYCEVCEAYAAVAGAPLRQRGFAPALSDEEALTMEIVGAYLGMNQDKQIWSYFHCHWRSWFPGLGVRSTFVRQAANLWAVKQCMHRHWVKRLGTGKGAVHLVDGFAMPVCHFRRAHFSQVFRGEATFGYSASKAQTYYGFKALLLTSGEGVIEYIALFGAHLDERDALVDMDLSAIEGMLLGDKGFIRRAARARRLVETVIGQLCERFEIEHNRARDLWHLALAPVPQGRGPYAVRFAQPSTRPALSAP